MNLFGSEAAQAPGPLERWVPHLNPLSWLRAAVLSLGCVVVCTALFISHVGYRHELDDQLQYLLLPYRQIYGRFLPGDWFTWHTTHYHQSFALLVRAVHGIAGEPHFERALFFAQGVSVALIAWGAMRLGQVVGAGRWGGLWVFIVMTWVRHAGPAGTVLSHPQWLPADMALGALLLALACFIAGRPLVSGLWLGGSAWLHANFAVLGALTLGLSLLGAWAPRVRKDRRRAVTQCGREAGWLLLGYLPPAAPSLWLIAHDFLAADPAAAEVDSLLRIRSPHHYDLEAMGPAEWYYPLCLLLCGLPWALRPRTPERGPAAPDPTDRGPAAPDPTDRGRSVTPDLTDRGRALLATLLVLLTVGTAGTALQQGALTRLFMFRLAIPLMVLCIALMAAELRSLARHPHLSGTLWTLTCALALLPFARSDVSQTVSFGLPLALTGLPLSLAIALASYGHLRRRPWWAAMGLVLAAGGAYQAVEATPQRHLRIGAMRKAQIAGPRLGTFIFSSRDPRSGPVLLERMLRERTPADARLLIPPGLITLRLHARRAVFVDAKATPMTGSEGLEWKRRMLAAMGTADFPATGYALRGAADRYYFYRSLLDLSRLARREGMTHLVSRQLGRIPGARHVFSAQGYYVYELR